MKIKDLFVKSIERPINGVIKADQRDEESIWQELDEYVVTKHITEYLRKFFDAYLAAIDNQNDPAIVARMGVWVSGFFGSGKSHFIKILSYLLSNLEAHKPGSTEQRKAIQFFDSKIKNDTLLLADIRRAVAGKTDVVLFNIDSKADAKTDRDAILQVFLRVFNEMQGLSGDAPHIAEMERYLISKGVYEDFKTAFKEQHGNSWETERDAVDFLRDDVIHALGKSLKMSEDSAGKYFDTARDTYKINIESFADLVRKYLDAKGAGHRVIFLVDEVGQFIGKNAQLMLNMQTITEELGTLCKGRAWVIVTSQEDIDATLGEANQAKSNDFSKITGRFHTRLSLSSSNTDEVIAKRLLEKKPGAREELEAIWKSKGDILNNQLSFANNAVTLRGFKDAADFAIHYPFVPYQFQLLQKVFESIRKVGATGRHLARGERSMLDAFQTAARRNSERGLDALVPLYDFYPSIESFLDSSVKRAIDQASENAALEPYDIKLLRVLFLIRYIPDTVKSSIENLATLCIDQIDADKLALKRQIEASLNRLERQNLVSRNGEFWFFLTNEERDVSQEIKAVEVSSTEIAKVVAELLFDEILDGKTKVRHRETKSDYEFNRLLDGTPWRQANQELTFEVLSPIGADYDMLSEARCIGRSAESGGRAILRMATDARIDVEIKNYVQIEKYILSPKAASPAPSLKRILENRKDENRERKGRLLIQLAEMMSAGDFYALGQKHQLKPLSPSSLLDEIVNYLVSNTYTKLTYIKVRQVDPIAEIRAVLSADTIGQKNIALDGADGNALALAEMRQYLHVAASASRVPLSDIVEKFARAPWGWKPEWETVLLISRLFMAGEIKLVLEGSDLDARSAIEPLTKSARFKQVSILRRKTSDAATRAQARDLHRDLFSLIAREDEDGLVGSCRENFGKLKAELERARVKAEQKHYPGAHNIAKALSQIDKQLAIRDPFEFLGALSEGKKDWLDLAEDTHDVLSFYKTQTIVWERMLVGFASFADNREALVKDATAAAGLTELETIRANANPYGQISRIDALVSAVEAVNDALASEKRSKALLSIDNKIEEVQAALSVAQADSDLSNRVLKPLQDLKAQLAGLVSIPRILFLQGRGGELLDEAMDRIAAAAAAKAKAQVKPITPPSSSGASASATTTSISTLPAPVAKPIRVIKLAELSSKSYLETDDEVEDYVAKLKTELLAVIASGHRARIQ
ncbi:BREX system P-loop protein BrxC [Glaciimonas sp. CA11.2]|uniref:BREX system P-loop protein BrxC n=1 Tax=Glaciimonas sp. CA11.2 TaxID=3048601 RepID=UPI002AB47F25|nr:BREX system P-loop protein BrxC [Glaciimonas sp. CA11.2]MDY7545494.1 BREX system P-loop protein BrxC [Glaciimonas sp. CA11.2]MEB0163070.1 BREX system P-loop protein BrxC [Glaciimonas sp. CA11.2]